jgi:uncharacterized protein (DUF1330 family)
MTVYMVAQVQVLDPEQWERYKEIASREIARHGGRYLTRGARPEVEEADWNQPEDLQINIAAFPSLRQAHAWYNSPEYAKALAFRRVAVRRRLFFVNGTDEPQAIDLLFPNGPWFLHEVPTMRSVATAVVEVFSGKDER